MEHLIQPAVHTGIMITDRLSARGLPGRGRRVAGARDAIG